MQALLPKAQFCCMPVPWHEALVLAPHPDDEIFGACLLLDELRRSQASITVAFFSDGDAYSTGSGGDRKKEAQASLSRLGAKGVFLGLEDGRLEATPGLEHSIGPLLEEIRPEVVILPWFGDYHSDHRAVARAAIGWPRLQAHYLFYSTYAPLWPGCEFECQYLMGDKGGILSALAGYQASTNREGIDGFLALRRALACSYLGKDVFWEPYLGIAGDKLADIAPLAAAWPPIYPTLKRARHWRRFLAELMALKSELSSGTGVETKI